MSRARLSNRPTVEVRLLAGPTEMTVVAAMSVPVVLSRAVAPRRDGRYYRADVRRARVALERKLTDYWKSLPMRGPA